MDRLALLLAACTLALPAVALADAVPAPPSNCPEGSHGRTGHAGPWCNPTTCTTDADCREEGTACREAALCVETEQYRMGGWAGDQQASRDVAHGPCNAGGQCTAGDCRRAKYCVRASGGASGGGETGDRDTDTDTDESDGPEEQPPTTMDTAPPGDSAEQGSERAAEQEEEDDDDGGCTVARTRAAPTWTLALVTLALGALRRRRAAH